MVSFRVYALVTVLATAIAIGNAFQTRKQFYRATIYLTQAKLNVVVLGNMAFMLIVALGKILKKAFLDTLTSSEVEELILNSKYAVTETCLALTIFREELTVRVVVLFTGLLFVKIFHWLAANRVDHMTQHRNLSLMTHVRLVCLLVLMCAIDMASVAGIVYFSNKGPSVLMLFGFEYLILLIMATSTLLKYVINVIDNRMDNRWALRPVFVFYLEFTADLLRLFMYLIFFVLICTYYGLPLHLVRELYVTVYKLRERFSKYYQYRLITRNMNERFPEATQEQLERGDRTCIICRDDMNTARVLPCGHMFHAECLRNWLERSQSCPICRANIPVSAAAPGRAEAVAAANAGVNVARLPREPRAAARQAEEIPDAPRQREQAPVDRDNAGEVGGAAGEAAAAAGHVHPLHGAGLFTPTASQGGDLSFQSPQPTRQLSNLSRSDDPAMGGMPGMAAHAGMYTSPYAAHSMSFYPPHMMPYGGMSMYGSPYAMPPYGGPGMGLFPSAQQLTLAQQRAICDQHCSILLQHIESLDRQTQFVRSLYDKQMSLLDTLSGMEERKDERKDDGVAANADVDAASTATPSTQSETKRANARGLGPLRQRKVAEEAEADESFPGWSDTGAGSDAEDNGNNSGTANSAAADPIRSPSAEELRRRREAKFGSPRHA